MTALKLWTASPMHRMNALTTLEEFDQIFQEMSQLWRDNQGLHSTSNFSTQLHSAQDHYQFLVEIPGVAKGDIEIEQTGDQLIVQATRRDFLTNNEKKQKVFKKSTTLPPDSDLENISAHYENGLLVIQIPRAIESKPKKIKINDGKLSFLKRMTGKPTTDSPAEAV